MEGRVEKVFMSIRKITNTTFGLFDGMTIDRSRAWRKTIQCLVMIAVVFMLGCSSDPADDPIPFQNFPDKVLNLNLPDNIGLRTKGASRAYNDIGIRGVIVYCADVGVYHAYERNCSFQPNEACATVNIDASTLFMVDPCCNSTFDFNSGMPTGGAAWRPLREYRTSFNGTDLVISDEVL